MSRSALVVAGVAIASTIAVRLLDGFLEAQPLAGILVSAVALDLLASRAGGELPSERPFLDRVRAALPWAGAVIVVVVTVLGAALVLGNARFAGTSFDPASIGLGLVRSLGLVARRQIPYAVVPLALLGARVDGRVLIVFAAVASAATGLAARDSALSVLVLFAASLFGALVLRVTRDFVAAVVAEGTLFFAVGTLFTSVLDVRLGRYAISPLERTQGPYAAALAVATLALAAAVFVRHRRVVVGRIQSALLSEPAKKPKRKAASS